MTRADDIDAAVGAGIINADQGEKLKAFFAQRASDGWSTGSSATDDTEFVRFARGFHDVFLTIGVTLLVSGAALTGRLVAVPIGFLCAAVVAWILAEVFTARRKLVLPSIALAIAFVASVFLGASVLMSGRSYMLQLDPFDLYSGLAGLGAAILFYARFRLPFALALIAIQAIVLLNVFLSFSYSGPPIPQDMMALIYLVTGIVILCAAMAFDLADRERISLRADNAFWLHLVAGPLIVHSAVHLLAVPDPGDMPITGAVTIMAVVAVLALVALIIDRRAMLVAGLIYLGFAISAVVRSMAFETGTVIALSVLLLGLGVVLLGSGWQRIRRVLIGTLVPDGIARRLPPIAARPT